jgi:hypothetical protein
MVSTNQYIVPDGLPSGPPHTSLVAPSPRFGSAGSRSGGDGYSIWERRKEVAVRHKPESMYNGPRRDPSRRERYPQGQ